MRGGHFPLDVLPAWCLLNDVTFVDAKVQRIEGRGYGLVAERELRAENDNEALAILKVPRDLVLSSEGIEEYAKENKEFRQLLDAAGRLSTRHDILLFLLMQLVLSSPDHTGSHGVTTPWTQYFSLLSTEIPVPTMWTEPETARLKGTSLEASRLCDPSVRSIYLTRFKPAVSAKLSVLTKEFDAVRAKTESLPLWYEIFSVDESVTVCDWVWLDALYRSRSLELPRSGESLVPCLDLVNHSHQHTAYFEETNDHQVLLLLRNGAHISPGTEITINYGHKKSAAEMLFSYGFIDPHSTTKSISLPLELIDDDPLIKAKLHVFGATPTLEINEDNGVPRWSAPFVYLMCLNEEDGLEFRILQETDGSRHLRMFWQERDVTDAPGTFKGLINGHELQKVFELRAVTVIYEMVQQQLERLSTHGRDDSISESVRAVTMQAANQLRNIETDLLKRAFQVLENERANLFSDESVLAYLGSMQARQSGDIAEDEDFS
ncbi:hypothetical protein DL766_004454 [Monosporascus sp. MC13-8B]|uniref:SET domain-containing protein n=1 Tax=Monosporascus cannonballus TaxID=155416 RepID=A0ABY0H2G2_9PEZI|nr:hypothetical protein DL762_006288 [Monosporascus cannonballus]RYP01379.1 hypothetical protein DL763_000189 [Monosporascus cannonballus]RYP31271.1 hypothetical protein DL766_004454 [Monosporascus sp. MC13-8B]